MKGLITDIGTFEIDISFIKPNPDQPRVTFDSDKLKELASSIESNGLLQPIVVRKVAENSYIIIAGERRYRAHKLLSSPLIQARVIECDDRTAYELTLLENIVREDLDLLEEARGYEYLKTKYNYTLDELAKVSNKSKPSISNICSILKEDPKVTDYIKDGVLTLAAYVWIKQLPNTKEKLDILEKLAQEKLKRSNIRKHVKMIIEAYKLAEKLGINARDIIKEKERGGRNRFDIKQKGIFPDDFHFHFIADFALTAEDIAFLPTRNVLFSAYYFLYNKGAARRLSTMLINRSELDRIFMDSGVMPAGKRKHWDFFNQMTQLCDFYDFIKPTVCVNMDVPTFPFVMDNWKISKKEMLDITLRNAKLFLHWKPSFTTTKVFPLQGTTPQEYLDCFYEYKKIGTWEPNDTTFGFGGIATTSGQNQVDIISYVMADPEVRAKRERVSFVHGFGVGNPQRIINLYEHGVNSFDALTVVIMSITGQYWLRNGKQAKHIIHESALSRKVRMHFNMISFWGQMASKFADKKGIKVAEEEVKIDLRGLGR